MTDKQIIIDGCDVSGCPHIEYEHKWWDIAGREQNSENVCSLSFDNNADFEEDFLCEQNPNCYYKQLKRKEEECEELKEALTEIKEIAEKNLNIHSCAFTGCGYDLITNQILRKISEVIDG